MLKNLCFPLSEKMITQGQLSSDQILLQIEPNRLMPSILILLVMYYHDHPLAWNHQDVGQVRSNSVLGRPESKHGEEY